MARPTKKQHELLTFIDDFIKRNGYGPSYREIMRALGYKSVSTVAVHIDGLIKGGYLRKKDHSARSIEVVTLGDSAASVMSEGVDDGEVARRWLLATAKKYIEMVHDRASLEFAEAIVSTTSLLWPEEKAVLQERLDRKKQSVENET